MYRVFLESPSDPDDDPLLILLRLDEHGIPVKEMGFGTCGEIGDPQDCNPFVLMNGSIIDYGSNYEDATERYWTIRWPGPMTVGGRVIVKVDDEDYDYRIRAVERVV